MNKTKSLEREIASLQRELHETQQQLFETHCKLQDLEEMDGLHPDKIRLDALEDLLRKATFTGRCRLVMNRNGKGFALEETNVTPNKGTIREAIDDLVE